jgi:hypothetical protein
MCTYRGFFQLAVVGFAKDRIVKVVKCSFPLKGKFMKCIEHVEGERSLRAVECRRKPTSSHDLCPFVDYTIGAAVTKVNRYVVDTRRIDDKEIWWSYLGRRT